MTSLSYLCRSEPGADGYELYLDETKEPEVNLRAVLEGDGFEERDGWLTRRVDRAEIKTAVLTLDRTLAQSATDAA